MSGTPVTFVNKVSLMGTWKKSPKQNFDPANNAYVDFNLDIGWALRECYGNRYSTTKREIRRYKRECCGQVVYNNRNCQRNGQQLRPNVDKKALEKHSRKVMRAVAIV
ncbi:hypothetical protein VTP01DRAFT_6746 [Rhizomucor pusillus]|uniref:uncharacterized protein n=1 Tax=Rhizomucor pusillus TaxID=4840 RepID=UPI0037429417